MSIQGIRNDRLRKAVVIVAVVPTFILILILATWIAVVEEIEEFIPSIGEAWRGEFVGPLVLNEEDDF